MFKHENVNNEFKLILVSRDWNYTSALTFDINIRHIVQHVEIKTQT